MVFVRWQQAEPSTTRYTNHNTVKIGTHVLCAIIHGGCTGHDAAEVHAEGETFVLPPAPYLDGKSIRAWWGPTSLAFLGDSVWEVRTLFSHAALLYGTITHLTMARMRGLSSQCSIWRDVPAHRSY